MSKNDFKKMFYTAFGKKDAENKKLIFNMLLPLIQAEPDPQNEADKDYVDCVSIGKLSSFIDFYNYVPLYFQTIRHKNQSSEDLYLFMGGHSSN